MGAECSEICCVLVIVCILGSLAYHTLKAMARTAGGVLSGEQSQSPVCEQTSSVRSRRSRSRSTEKQLKTRSGPSGKHKNRPTNNEMREMLLMSKAEAECLRVLAIDQATREGEKRETFCMMKAEIDSHRSASHDLRQGEHGWEQVLDVLTQQTRPDQIMIGDGLEMLKSVIIRQAKAIAIYKRKWQLACFMLEPV